MTTPCFLWFSLCLLFFDLFRLVPSRKFWQFFNIQICFLQALLQDSSIFHAKILHIFLYLILHHACQTLLPTRSDNRTILSFLPHHPHPHHFHLSLSREDSTTWMMALPEVDGVLHVTGRAIVQMDSWRCANALTQQVAGVKQHRNQYLKQIQTAPYPHPL